MTGIFLSLRSWGIYSLFIFDRKLRFLCLRVLTTSETLLRTACAYCFSESHPNEKNAYLNRENYSQDLNKEEDVCCILSQFEKIVKKSRTSPTHGGKEYLYRCMVDHNSEIPLWVMVNDMVKGQVPSM